MRQNAAKNLKITGFYSHNENGNSQKELHKQLTSEPQKVLLLKQDVVFLLRQGVVMPKTYRILTHDQR